MAICQLVYRYPILLDAATAAVMRKGDRFLARWGDIMTGGSPKFHLLHPDFVIVITFELVLLFIKRLFGFQSVTKKKQEWPMCLAVKDQLGIAIYCIYGIRIDCVLSSLLWKYVDLILFRFLFPHYSCYQRIEVFTFIKCVQIYLIIAFCTCHAYFG